MILKDFISEFGSHWQPEYMLLQGKADFYSKRAIRLQNLANYLTSDTPMVELSSDFSQCVIYESYDNEFYVFDTNTVKQEVLNWWTTVKDTNISTLPETILARDTEGIEREIDLNRLGEIIGIQTDVSHLLSITASVLVSAKETGANAISMFASQVQTMSNTISAKMKGVVNTISMQVGNTGRSLSQAFTSVEAICGVIAPNSKEAINADMLIAQGSQSVVNNITGINPMVAWANSIDLSWINGGWVKTVAETILTIVVGTGRWLWKAFKWLVGNTLSTGAIAVYNTFMNPEDFAVDNEDNPGYIAQGVKRCIVVKQGSTYYPFINEIMSNGVFVTRVAFAQHYCIPRMLDNGDIELNVTTTYKLFDIEKFYNDINFVISQHGITNNYFTPNFILDLSSTLALNDYSISKTNVQLQPDTIDPNHTKTWYSYYDERSLLLSLCLAKKIENAMGSVYFNIANIFGDLDYYELNGEVIGDVATTHPSQPIGLEQATTGWVKNMLGVRDIIHSYLGKQGVTYDNAYALIYTPGFTTVTGEQFKQTHSDSVTNLTCLKYLFNHFSYNSKGDNAQYTIDLEDSYVQRNNDGYIYCVGTQQPDWDFINILSVGADFPLCRMLHLLKVSWDNVNDDRVTPVIGYSLDPIDLELNTRIKTDEDNVNQVSGFIRTLAISAGVIIVSYAAFKTFMVLRNKAASAYATSQSLMRQYGDSVLQGEADLSLLKQSRKYNRVAKILSPFAGSLYNSSSTYDLAINETNFEPVLQLIR